MFTPTAARIRAATASWSGCTPGPASRTLSRWVWLSTTGPGSASGTGTDPSLRSLAALRLLMDRFCPAPRHPRMTPSDDDERGVGVEAAQVRGVGGHDRVVAFAGAEHDVR